MEIYLSYHFDEGFVAVKIGNDKKTSNRELDTSIDLEKYFIFEIVKQSPFVLKHIQYTPQETSEIFIMEYCNSKTLNIIAKQPNIILPTYTLRALMKQIIEGMRTFHSSGLVHRDIKVDNILLHSPHNSAQVHAKISDFGFALKEDQAKKLTYQAGTAPYMALEMFKKPLIITQKVDIFALAITFL
ncbi:MAG: hypothetical protein EZS28_036597, partial [Streblomastix strix]